MADNDADNTNKPGKPDQAERRKTVRRMLVGGGIVTAGSQLPGKWTKPTVETVLMAAHAGTSPTPTQAPVSGSVAPTISPSAAPSSAPSSAPSTASG